MIEFLPTGRVRLEVDDTLLLVERATVGDLRWLGLLLEDAMDVLSEATMSDLLTDLNPCPSIYARLIARKTGAVVAEDDLPGWAMLPHTGIRIVEHWQTAPLSPWDAAHAAPESAGPFGSPQRSKDDDAMTIEPTRLPGILGELALLYRMMAMIKYRIPDVNAMLVIECAIALGVDQNHTPRNVTAAVADESRPDAAAMMLVPTEVMIMDPDSLLGQIGFAETSPGV